ncbi:MAG: hypothetical protein ACYCZ1_06715 [Candidatus Humimicrobiaceae bacterium]
MALYSYFLIFNSIPLTFGTAKFLDILKKAILPELLPILCYIQCLESPASINRIFPKQLKNIYDPANWWW